ncbi:hypothetical protein [Burkholderia diffusa]|uniref:hypothetical protein n=1 Tax=Burkholderia diffusa TaxID=488732 RepID=UPI001588A18A|nr:hypothetical protein [Burkholderia diffusa]
MEPTAELEAARHRLRELRAEFYQRYADRQALMDRKIAEHPDQQLHPDAEAQCVIAQQQAVLNESIAYAAAVVEQFDAKPTSEVFHFLIEHDPILESTFGASPIQLATKKGTLRRLVLVTTDDGRKLKWIGLFLASGQWVGLENCESEELWSPREREIANEGRYVEPNLDVQLIKDGQLVDGTMTNEGLFFPIDGPLAFLNAHRACGD